MKKEGKSFTYIFARVVARGSDLRLIFSWSCETLNLCSLNKSCSSLCQRTCGYAEIFRRKGLVWVLPLYSHVTHQIVWVALDGCELKIHVEADDTGKKKKANLYSNCFAHYRLLVNEMLGSIVGRMRHPSRNQDMWVLFLASSAAGLAILTNWVWTFHACWEYNQLGRSCLLLGDLKLLCTMQV